MSFEMALSRDLPETQRAFVSAVSVGTDPETAAIESGYSPLSARRIAYDLLHQPAILAAVQIAIARNLASAAPAALKLLRHVIATETYDIRLRIVCARDIMNRAGHIAPKAIAASTGASVPLNEMSMADLRTLADKLEGEIAGRAKDVSSAKPAPSKVQTIEDIM